MLPRSQNSGTTQNTTATIKDHNGLPELPLLGNQRRWDTAKLAIRSICLMLGVSALCLAITLRIGYRTGIGAIVYAAPASTTSVAWNIAEFIVICVHRDRSKGITPGAHVGCDLLLWFGCLFTTGFIFWQADVLVWDNEHEPYAYVLFQSWVPGVYIALCLMVTLLTVLHFVLFVRACIEVDRRSKNRQMQLLILAMAQRGQDPRDYPLATLQHAAQISGSLPDNDSGRDFVLKYNNIAAPVPEMGPSEPTADVNANGSQEPREVHVDVPPIEELPVCPEDAGINQKVLLDDVIRQARARPGERI